MEEQEKKTDQPQEDNNLEKEGSDSKIETENQKNNSSLNELEKKYREHAEILKNHEMYLKDVHQLLKGEDKNTPTAEKDEEVRKYYKGVD